MVIHASSRFVRGASLLLLGTLASALLLGCNDTAAQQPPAAPGVAAASATPQSFAQGSAQAALPPLVAGLPDFTLLVERVAPAVVNIRTLEKRHARSSGGSAPEQQMEELLRRFFGIPLPDRRRAPAPDDDEDEGRPTGVGSGFIISADGYIMTNAHVVDDADTLIVTLADKREFKAKLIGKDTRTDVALVKVDASGLPAATIGNAAALKVGQWVVAIGSPFGLDNTVTAGIVSAKQRDTGEYLPFIQTDVAVNPGNSGGPLINMAGEVVGINSQIYSRSGGFMGISFAIPIDEAMRVADQLRATGSVTRGRIGVQVGAVGKEVAESIGLGKDQGALVRSVESGSPAEKAGVQPGDVITRFNGQAIEKVGDLPRMVGDTRPGSSVGITVWRNGAGKDLQITVEKMQEESAAGGIQRLWGGEKNKGAAPAAGAAATLGLQAADLNAQQRQALRGKGGVLVQAVEPDGPAERAGLQAGDIVLSLNNRPIDSAAALDSAAAQLSAGKAASLLFLRADMAQYTTIRPKR